MTAALLAFAARFNHTVVQPYQREFIEWLESQGHTVMHVRINGMNYREAMVACVKGCDVRRPHWSEGVSVGYDCERDVFVWSHTCGKYEPIYSDSIADDWVTI